MTVYEGVTCTADVREVEVADMTDKSVFFLDGRRCARKNGYSGFFATRKDAVRHIESYYEEEIAKLKREVAYYQKRLDEFRILEAQRAR